MNMVKPLNYNLQITPDLNSFSFTGKLKLSLNADKEVEEVTLNALDLEIQSITFEETELEYDYSLEDQELTIKTGSVEGDFELIFQYKGEINNKLAGFYRSNYELDGEEKYCAVTQFQESDARRAFPSFDTPELKATFEVELIVEQNQIAISNTSIEKEEILDNGKKKVVFEKTPLISTYLVFLAVGDFEYIEDKYRNIPIRLVASPGKPQKYGEFGLDYGVQSLQYCEEFFEIKYPLSKLDLIATPDFAAGAMENWGAILFRENLLLYYPGVTSEQNKTRIKEVIAHEVAHQWFGNLVSPNSWKYVWLNESFATYFAYKTIEHYEPEYGIFDYFVGDNTVEALTADGYHETAPIEQKGDERAAYTVKTVPIMYSKGGSVLRQLEGFLGQKNFQKGLQHYLNKHEYDVASSEDLWVSFEKVSGKPITEMMNDWVLQMGYPIITVKRKDDTLYLEQSRFTYLNKDYDTTWMIPVSVKQYFDEDNSSISKHLMKDRKMEIELDPSCVAIKINTDQTGFYRVQYENDEYSKLGEFIKNGDLSPIDRFSLENDKYALLKSTNIDLEDYLSFISYYEKEDNHLPLEKISTHLNDLYKIFDGENQEKIAKAGKEFLEPVLDRIGYTPREDEHHTISILRGKLIYYASKFGSDKATEFALNEFEKLRDDGDVDSDLYVYILMIAARETNDWDWFVDKFNTVKTEVEKGYYTAAISNFTSKENIEKVKLFIFDEVPSRNRRTAINTLTQNSAAKGTIWEWFLANLDNFEKLHPFMYQSVLTNVIIASVNHKEEVIEFFDEYVKDNPRVKDPVDKALETMEIREKLINSTS